MKRVFMAVLGLSLLIACSSHHSESDIHLNGGEKWQVNPEMRPHIEKGQKLLSEYVSSGDQDYQTLVENLQAQNNSLIKSCTMKGESHDELHKWLHPHIELVDQLSKAENSKEAGEIVSDLRQSYNTYQNYFE